MHHNITIEIIVLGIQFHFSKLIGARYYNDPVDEEWSDRMPRNKVGHGTHVASTVDGNPIPGHHTMV